MSKSTNTEMQELTLSSARELQQHGRFNDAEQICRQIMEQSSEESEQISARVLLALVLVQKGNPGEEVTSLLTDLPSSPDCATSSDLGLVCLLRGDLQRGQELLDEAVKTVEADYVAYSRHGSLRLLAGDFAGGEESIREALARSPDHPLILSNLAGALMRQDKVVKALEAYEAALRLQPGLPTAEKGKVAALMMLDRVDELLDEVDSQLEAEPGAASLLLRKIQILIVAERFDEARDVLREIIDLYPDELDYRLQLAGLHMREEQHQMALKVLQTTDDRFPEQPQVLNLLARTYNNLKQHEKAMDIVDRLLELQPDMSVALLTRAIIYSDQEEYSVAESDLRKVIETHPGIAEAWSLLGHNLLWTGRLDEAVECLERAAQINPGALAALVEARAIPEDPAVMNVMSKFASHKLIASEARASMNFALIKVFEKKKDYEKAFDHARTANQLTRKLIKYNYKRHCSLTEKIIQVFNPDLFNRLDGLGNYSERPVFVVGMPRSGTTLTEQILCSHPDVFGAGELGYMPSITRLMPRVLKVRKPFPVCMQHVIQRTIDHASIYYLQKLDRYDAYCKRVVDKLPHNFMNIGLIAILFPHARIIHVRRDLRDIAISNYFINFKMKRGGMGYAFDLEEIGHMLNDYRRIMDHWREVLPIEIYEFEYEKLVSNTETEAKKLIDFIGMDWDPGVLDFYKQDRAVRTASVWQVRQPIYKSSKARWKHYDDFLEPLYNVINDYEEKNPVKQKRAS